MAPPLLQVRNLTTVFGTPTGEVAAIEDVGFDLAAGEVLGIVGESGSGKSVTALSVMGLLPEPPARIDSGSIRFEGEDLLGASRKRRRALRGAAMGMVFQEPMTSLNPVFTIGDQIVEAVRAHSPLGAAAAREIAIGLLARVGIPSPQQRMSAFPHQLSGGMRQRVMLAIALAAGPRLLIADEPTTALDVTIQAQLLDLLGDLRRQTGMAVLIITHNMGVIAEFADRVLVMYAGRVVEEAPVEALFDAPFHPYTKGLLASTPSLERDEPRLRTIPGTLPGIDAKGPGCAFAPRCQRSVAACSHVRPELETSGDGRKVACLRWAEPDMEPQPEAGARPT
jgi:peptide/nickel transport system ATP-binding protein/oligopeptide transport system ATP-binding protein